MVDGQTPLFKVLDKSDGLLSNFVYRVLEDMDGFIWICTDGGVCKYDGQTMKCFDQTDGLPDKDVYNITLDDLGRLWLLHVSNKIAFIQNDSVHVFPTSSPIRVQVEYRNNAKQHGIQIGNDDLYIIDNKNNVKVDEILSGWDNTTGLIWNDMYFSHSSDNENFVIQNLKNELVKELSEIVIDVENESITQYHHPTQTFQIYTGNKIYVYDTSFAFQEIIDVNLSKNLNILSALRDTWGNLWVCTRKGIYFQSRSQRMHGISIQENSKDINFIKTLESKVGPILIDDNGGIYKYMSDSLILIGNKEMSSGQIYDADISGDYLYISSGRTGLIRINISRDTKLGFEPRIAPSKKFVLLDNTRAICVGRRIREIDIEAKKNTVIGLNYCNSIAYDKTNKMIWVSNNDSLYVYNDDNKKMSLKKSIPFPLIENIKNIGSGKTFITTFESKNYICDDIDCEELQVSTHVRSIKLSNGTVWLNTDGGILKSIFNVVDSGEYVFESYFDYSSLQNDVIVNDISVYDDYLLLATAHGIIKVDELEIPKSKAAIPISINFINNLIVDTTNIVLNYSDRNITIGFNAKYFTNRNELRYEYLLEGADQDNTIKDDQVVRYVDLASGNYTFRVRALDTFGNVSEYAKLNIFIKKPWYHRPIVYIVGFFFLLTIGYLIFRSYIARVNKKNELQQQFAELELSALQSQMNPHFVFNAMNSIQNLITSNRPEEADLYVTRLAVLMRKYLDSSKEKYVSIDEELNIVRLYLQLEELRFGKKIAFHIDNKLDSKDISKRIPATIIQPFAENALKHGLFHKRVKGNLYIRLYDDASNIYIEIEDDGIGRKRVKEIQDSSRRDHKSTGLKSIKSKLEVLRKLDKVDIEYSVVDLYEGKTAIGTKVIIRMSKN